MIVSLEMIYEPMSLSVFVSVCGLFDDHLLNYCYYALPATTDSSSYDYFRVSGFNLLTPLYLGPETNFNPHFREEPNGAQFFNYHGRQ